MNHLVTPACEIRTQSGLLVNPLNLKMKDIRLDDIAFALASIRRFGGHTRLSVAQHSCHVAEELMRMGVSTRIVLAGLLHDATEAYLVDVPRPLKRLPRFRWYRDTEDRAMGVIARVFQFDCPLPPEVHHVDARMLRTEQRDLMGRCPKETDIDEPLPIRINPWSSEKAELQFLRRFHSLVGI